MSPVRNIRRPNVWIPAVFVGMFAVVLVANGAMVWVALGTWRGLQTEDAYEKGLAYDETLANEAREQALGWDVDVATRSRGDGRVDVAVTLADADGRPVHAERVRVGFVRPTQEGYDTVVALAPRGGGRYAAEGVRLPLAGLWELRVAAVRGRDAVRVSRRIQVAP